MADDKPKEGDQVSWQWSGSRPGGEVSEVKESGQVEMETKNGNVVTKKADGPENPALKIERSGHDVVKKANEVEVEQAGDKHKEDKGEEKTVGEEDQKKENGDAETGDKRKAEETAEEKKDEEDGDNTKKQKKSDDEEEEEEEEEEHPKENDEEAPKKKAGRPKKAANGESGSAPASASKKKEPKKAATETGEPRRSGRNASKSS